MKTVLITGASKGIGRQAAFALGDATTQFSHIVLLGRKSDHFDQTVVELREKNPVVKVTAIEADLSNPYVVDDVFKQLDDLGIQLNTIINNAGFTKPASINETTMDDFEKTMRVNLYSPFRIIQSALYHRHPLGQIINIASTAGMNGRAGWLTYSASKAAIINMSEVLREELKPYGIDVTCLSPGRCATDLRRELAPDEDPSTIMQPKQVAEVIELMTQPSGMLLNSQNIVVRT